VARRLAAVPGPGQAGSRASTGPARDAQNKLRQALVLAPRRTLVLALVPGAKAAKDFRFLRDAGWFPREAGWPSREAGWPSREAGWPSREAGWFPRGAGG
jgi:hypothetical protein